jgi:hypothetical protein
LVVEEVAPARLADLRQARFLTPGPIEGRWSLSRSGRMALRRRLSQGGGVTAADAAGQHQLPAPKLKGSARAAEAPSRRPGFNDAESPLQWLARRKLLSPQQVDAGERLRSDFTFSGLTPRLTVNWDAIGPGSAGRRPSPGAGLELSDRVVAARQRFDRALSAVGPELAGILIDVCCHLKGIEIAERAAGWPVRSGRIVLGLALSALARHYGIVETSAPAASRPARIRHWGGEGYRPRTD